MQMRAAGKSFNQLLAGAGASIASMASSEIYNAMQTGVLDGRIHRHLRLSHIVFMSKLSATPAGDQALVHVSTTAHEQVNV